MKARIRLPKARLLCCSLLLFSLFFIHQSCTKLDTAVPSGNALTDEEATQKFFNVPADAPAAAKRLAAELKRRNDSSEFVRGFVRNNGYPAWDKVLLPVEHAIAHASFSADASSGDTVIIVPVVPQGQSVVGSFIKAFLSGDANVSLYRGGDYAAYSFNDVPADSISADKAAIQIMILNNYVFGYASFKINDDRLFSSIAPNPGHKPRTATVAPEGSPGLLGEMLCTRVCISILCTVCYQMSCPYTTTTCLTSCESIGPSNPGGDPTTGGGGGGGTPPGDFPCAGSQGKGIGIANPCGGGPTIPPVEPIPLPKPPCEKVAAIFQIPAVRTGYHDLVDFSEGDTEYGTAWNAAGGQYLSGGTPGGGEVEINLVANCISYAHCHNAGAEYYMFSLGDLEEVFNNIDLNKVDDHIVVGLITPDGTPYLLTIEDRSAFLQAFANMITYNPNIEKREKKYFNYFVGLTTRAENEMAFLKFMSDINAGIGLVRANAAFTEFTELKLNTDRAGVTEYPCR